MLAPIIAIIGRPNVGKSTLFNRLVGRKQAIVSDSSGTTRDSVYGNFDYKNKNYRIVDTAGLYNLRNSKIDELTDLIKDSVFEAISEADLILFVTDYDNQADDLDKMIAAILRRQKKPVITVVNKCDNSEHLSQIEQFKRFGNWPTIGISATLKINLDCLLEEISTKISGQKIKKEEPKSDLLSIAIVGRPNVGKSTLYNSFSPGKKAIVSKIAGTTRDLNQKTIEYKGEKIVLYDTAGIIRSGKSGRGVERFSLIRTLQAIEFSDVVILLIDPTEGVTGLEKKIAGYVENRGRGLILAYSKIDLLENLKNFEDGKNELIFLAQKEFNFLPYVPLIFISAEKQKNIFHLIKNAIRIKIRLKTKVNKEELTKLIGLVEESFGQFPKVISVEQTETEPPTFKLKLKKNEKWHFSFARFFENRLRDNFDLSGVPIRIKIEVESTKKNLNRQNSGA
jgi:GTP-binding protein